jgi:hypothetical protein
MQIAGGRSNLVVLPARYLRGWLYGAWFSLLNLTRPIRHRLGLKQEPWQKRVAGDSAFYLR